MDISSFEDLLQAARQQPDPQRLLFVFTRSELPDNPTAEEKARFESGEGGTLAPVMFVDKALEELRSFAELAEESRHTGQDWQVMFVGCLGGHNGAVPTADEAQEALELMVKSIQGGIVDRFLAYRPDGEQIHFV